MCSRSQMGFLKKRVRGPLRECEAILNDLLALERAQVLVRHDSYMPDHELLQSARRMRPDGHFKGEGDVTFVGAVISNTDFDALKGFLRSFLRNRFDSNEAGDDLYGWEPEDYQLENLRLEEYQRASPWQHCKLTATWNTEDRKTCDNFFLLTVPKSPDSGKSRPTEPTTEELLNLEYFPRDFEHADHDFLYDTFGCEVRPAPQNFVFFFFTLINIVTFFHFLSG